MAYSLFDPPPAEPIRIPLRTLPAKGQIGIGRTLRDYQIEDVDWIDDSFAAGKKRVLCVGATGLGKGLEIAELSARHVDRGRVVVLVDSKTLVEQLADEIEHHLGEPVGSIARGNCTGITRRVVVSTVQAMYTPDQKDVRLMEYSPFKPSEVSLVIGDETESLVAPTYRTVPEHFLSNDKTLFAGFTATPKRGDKLLLSVLFDHAADVDGPGRRTIHWGMENGWLVEPMETFVHVNLDFSTLAIATTESGEKDFTQDGLTDALIKLSQEESTEIAFAKGIISAVGDRQGLIFAPAKIKAAQALCHYLNEEAKRCGRGNICDVVWGTRADGRSVIDRFREGSIQLLSSVNQLTKGLDAPRASAEFICRLTTIWRLYTQMVGRILRPHPSIVPQLNSAGDPTVRRRLIRESAKPDALVVDLVGISDDTRAMQLIDVLGDGVDEETKTEAKKIMMRRGRAAKEAIDPRSVLKEAGEEVASRQRERMLKDQKLREMIRVEGTVETTTDAKDTIKGAKHRNPASEKQIDLYVAMATEYPPDQAKAIAESRDANQLRGMIGGLFKRRRKPDWSRVNNLGKGVGTLMEKTVSTGGFKQPSEVPPTPWQIEQLKKNDVKIIPETSAQAVHLLREASRRTPAKPELVVGYL